MNTNKIKKTKKKMFVFLKEYFTAYFHLNKIEDAIVGDLENGYISYQSKPTFDKLHRLMIDVAFCQRNRINGKTKKIQNEIKEAWLQETNGKEAK